VSTDERDASHRGNTAGQVMLETADRLVVQEIDPAVQRYLLVGALSSVGSNRAARLSTPRTFSLAPQERRAARIDDGIIRVSCGVEPSDLLVGDFVGALDGRLRSR
jgi:cystathionine beta-lyase/cystathionine gamma-synthase